MKSPKFSIGDQVNFADATLMNNAKNKGVVERVQWSALNEMFFYHIRRASGVSTLIDEPSIAR